jgi:hypothetical protein
MSAFRPQYLDGDVQGLVPFPLHGCTRHGRSDNSPRFNAGRARIHLSLERWRVCETWFAPSMAGVDSAGLGEVLQNVLASFSLADRERLVQVRAFLSLSLPPCLILILPSRSHGSRMCFSQVRQHKCQVSRTACIRRSAPSSRPRCRSVSCAPPIPHWTRGAAWPSLRRQRNLRALA